MIHLELFLLGRWQAYRDGDMLAPLPTRHARALLARLALAHPTGVTRTGLLHDLFPDASPARAAQHLRTTLFYVRNALGNGIHTTGDTITIDPTWQVTHDVARFEQQTVNAATIAALQSAMLLYRGPFLQHQSDGWAATTAERLHTRYLQTLQRIITLTTSGGHIAEALPAAVRWVREEPWEERAHLAVIEALFARNERAAAEQQIVQARQVLGIAWNEPLSPTFESLARAVDRLPRSATALPAPTPPRIEAHTWEHLPLVGRDAELGHLNAAWERAQQGTAQVLIVEGPAGIGKSRLVAEWTARLRLRRQPLILTGRASVQAEHQYLGVVRAALREADVEAQERMRAASAELDDLAWQVLGSSLPELHALLPERAAIALPPLEGSAEGTRRQRAVLLFAERLGAQGPVLLVLEDTHNADEAILPLVAELASLAAPLCVVLTRRPGSDAQTPEAPTLTLAPLPADATTHLIRLALGASAEDRLLHQLLARSGGTPLFVRELVRVLQDQHALRWEPTVGWQLQSDALRLPDPLTDLLKERLAPIGGAARTLAEQLAVLARPADEHILEQLWSDERVRLLSQTELIRSGVVQHQGLHLGFTHAWLGETLLQSLLPDARRSRHQEIAAALASHPDTTPYELMEHELGAGLWESALDRALVAGKQAQSAGLLRVMHHAIEGAQKALDHLTGAADDERRWQWWLLRERYATVAEGGTTTNDLHDDLVRFAAGSGRADWHSHALVLFAEYERNRGNRDATRAMLHQAVALAQQAHLPDLEADARISLAVFLDDESAVEEGLHECTEARQAAHGSADLHLRSRIEYCYANALSRVGRSQEAVDISSALLATEYVQQDRLLTIRVLRVLSTLEMQTHAYEQALEHKRECATLAQSVGDLQSAVLSRDDLVYSLTQLGLYDEAAALAEATVPLAHAQQMSMVVADLYYSWARAALHLGDAPSARAYAEDSVARFQGLALDEYAACALELAIQIAAHDGRWQEARQKVEHGRKLLAGLEHPAVKIDIVAAEVYLACGLGQQARQAAERVVATADDEGWGTISTPEQLWIAANVLAVTDGPQRGEPLKEQAYASFLDRVGRLRSPALRRALVNATAVHRALAAYRSAGPRRLAHLALPDAPTGRPLLADEYVPVVWTLHASDDSPSSSERRRQQLQRLATEAIEQGALATVEALAQVLGVSTRTVQRDLQALRAAGITIPTRSPASR